MLVVVEQAGIVPTAFMITQSRHKAIPLPLGHLGQLPALNEGRTGQTRFSIRSPATAAAGEEAAMVVFQIKTEVTAVPVAAVQAMLQLQVVLVTLHLLPPRKEITEEPASTTVQRPLVVGEVELRMLGRLAFLVQQVMVVRGLLHLLQGRQ